IYNPDGGGILRAVCEVLAMATVGVKSRANRAACPGFDAAWRAGATQNFRTGAAWPSPNPGTNSAGSSKPVPGISEPKAGCWRRRMQHGVAPAIDFPKRFILDGSFRTRDGPALGEGVPVNTGKIETMELMDIRGSQPGAN